MKFLLTAMVALTLMQSALAEAPASPPRSPAGMPARTKSLDFDDETVEGMNRNPLDSLTRVGRRDQRDHDRLYRRKQNFKREIRQTVREMGYTQ